MGDFIETNVCLINEKVRFEAHAKQNPSVYIDYIPPIGDGDGYTSLELFLMSLASCVGTAVISILRKMGKKPTKFKIYACGHRRDTHPTCFEKVTLRFTICSPNTCEDDVRKAIAIAENSICPVWAMIKNNVEVSCEIELEA